MIDPIEITVTRLLARREHTRRELKEKLLRRGFSEAEFDSVLDACEEKGWIDEHRYVNVYLRSKRNRFGIRKLLSELESKGISRKVLQKFKGEILLGEFEAARLIWSKKFSETPINPVERSKQVRFMIGRGFEQETIKRVLSLETNHFD